MSLNYKSLEALTEADLQSLIDNSVAEGKTIDYKRDLIGSSSDDKKEFLYDVSSFANASGGHLILGVDEAAGIPIDVCGLEIGDVDAERLRLDNIIRDGIAPRIPGLVMQPISLRNQRTAIVVQIPKSWAAPHMVVFKGASKFYSRNSAGKYPLDVGEIRAAFILSETAVERIRNFRRERLGMIVADETPIPLAEKPRLVLHVVPLAAFDLASQFDVTSLYNGYPQPLSRVSRGSHRRLNFDGLLSFNGILDRETHSYLQGFYLQVFRNGIIEAVDTSCFLTNYEHGFIDPEYEDNVLQRLRTALEVQKYLGVGLPVLAILSFIGVRGYKMPGQNFLRQSISEPIDRDTLLTNEILIEDFDADLTQLMKPAFDAVWNAAGLPKSSNYDETGTWIRKK